MLKFVIDKDDEYQTQVTISLNARRTSEGNVVIFDHPLIDIFIDRQVTKVVTLPKDDVNDEVYYAQNRLMKFLRTRGVIDPDSIQGGNIYGAVEAVYPETSEDGEPVQHVIFAVARFLEKENPTLEFIKSYKKSIIEPMVNPSAEDSTELGEIPHRGEQGALSTGISKFNSIYRAY